MSYKNYKLRVVSIKIKYKPSIYFLVPADSALCSFGCVTHLYPNTAMSNELSAFSYERLAFCLLRYALLVVPFSLFIQHLSFIIHDLIIHCFIPANPLPNNASILHTNHCIHSPVLVQSVAAALPM